MKNRDEVINLFNNLEEAIGKETIYKEMLQYFSVETLEKFANSLIADYDIE